VNVESGETTEEDDVMGAEEVSERQKDWDEDDGEKQGVDFRDKVKHVERNNQLFVERMMLMANRG